MCSPGEMVAEIAQREGIEMHTVPMPRHITPLVDIMSLCKLVLLFRRLRPDIVHAHTPKGGLLGTLAAVIAGVPVRCYTMRGLPMMTAKGLRRRILKWCETVSCASVDRVFCNSRSLRDVALQEGLLNPAKFKVLCNGSGNGVDSGFFAATANVKEKGGQIRKLCGITDADSVIGFVGRVVRDKGILELADAWRSLHQEFPNLYLFVLGPFETQDRLPGDVVTALRTDSRIQLLGRVAKQDMPAYYAAMDFVVLPTYREGLPNVPLEAATMELPVVATRIPGCVDAVVDGVTGILVPARNSVALADAIRKLLTDPELRQRMGKAGRERVVRDFPPEPIWEALYQEYMGFLGERKPEARGLKDGSAIRIKKGPLLKRVMDVLCAGLGLAVLAPLLFVITFLIRMTMGGPVLYVSHRPGLGERIFRLYKFRTMTEERDQDDRLLPDAQRLSRLGRFLRRWSLDEIPELWNVLRGDMSLIGPRPLLERYLPFYTPNEKKRHMVRPGITGWAQVNGRNLVPWDRRLEMDVWYVENRSLRLDLKILLLTVYKSVIRRIEIVLAPSTLMEPLDVVRSRHRKGNE